MKDESYDVGSKGVGHLGFELVLVVDIVGRFVLPLSGERGVFCDIVRYRGGGRRGPRGARGWA